VTIILENDPPEKPTKPTGPPSVEPGEIANFGTSAIDPNGDNIEYGWDWDEDSNVDVWTEANNSGEFITQSHSWDIEGTFKIKVKARDTYLPDAKAESEWSDPLEITIDKSRAKDKPLFIQKAIQFFENWNSPFLTRLLNFYKVI
jgi:hypothetical protein